MCTILEGKSTDKIVLQKVRLQKENTIKFQTRMDTKSYNTKRTKHKTPHKMGDKTNNELKNGISP